MSQEKISNKESGELDIILRSLTPQNLTKLSPSAGDASKRQPPIFILKQRRKWGWGWFVVLSPYPHFLSRYPVEINNYLIKTLIELGGAVFLLICYFWIRNYIGRYSDDLYKPSIISGVLSIFLVGCLIGLLEAFLHGY